MDIIKTIVPIAGRGTRFLPYTLTIPKEMVPLINKPAIHYLIEEIVTSAIEHIILITAKGKESIIHYLDTLVQKSEEPHTHEFSSTMHRLLRDSTCTSVYQPEPLGLGHAIWQARHMIGKEYFAICLPDDIIINTQPTLSQLIRIARQEKTSVIAVQEVAPESVSSYGIVAVKKQFTPNLFQISHLVEKPEQHEAPSNLAIVGRYILSHKIFNALEQTTPSAQGEIQLTDAISHMMQTNERVFAYKIPGTWLDVGTPLGLIKATLHTALNHAEYGAPLRKYIAEYHTTLAINKTKVAQHNPTTTT
jgi:UTP--glucose-1-phosphate uridylyltransferase